MVEVPKSQEKMFAGLAKLGHQIEQYELDLQHIAEKTAEARIQVERLEVEEPDSTTTKLARSLFDLSLQGAPAQWQMLEHLKSLYADLSRKVHGDE